MFLGCDSGLLPWRQGAGRWFEGSTEARTMAKMNRFPMFHLGNKNDG